MNEQINKLISVPNELRTNDGRVLKIIQWETSVGVEKPPTVKISAHIEEDAEINHRATKHDSIQTFGGEGWLDEDYYLNDYGVGIGDVSISGLTGDQARFLAVTLVNHLVANGYSASIEEEGGTRTFRLK